MGPAKKRKSDVPVFRPSLEQLAGSFEAYVENIERKIGGPGIAKIVAPKGWTPRKRGYKKVDIQIPQPIKQLATGSRGLYRLLLVQGKPQSSARDFKPMAVDRDNQPPVGASHEELERHYWRNLTLRPPQYGADIEGSLFDRGLKVRLGCLTILRLRLGPCDKKHPDILCAALNVMPPPLACLANPVKFCSDHRRMKGNIRAVGRSIREPILSGYLVRIKPLLVQACS